MSTVPHIIFFVASFIKYSMNILFQGINASLKKKCYHVAEKDIIYVLYSWQYIQNTLREVIREKSLGLPQRI